MGEEGKKENTNYHDTTPANHDIDGALLGVACELTQGTSALLTGIHCVHIPSIQANLSNYSSV